MTSSSDGKLKGRPYFAGALLAAGVALAAVVIQSIPGAGEALQWRRDGGFSAFLTTGLTGHLTHWSWDHLAWDLAAFLALSFAAIRLTGRQYGICLLVAAILIPLEIGLFRTEFSTYRGLSGIDSALFGLVIAGLWNVGGRAKGFPAARVMAVAGLVAFLGKSVFEMTTGETVFVASEEPGFVTVVSAHVTGVVCGLVVGFWGVRGFGSPAGCPRHEEPAPP